MRKNKVTMAKPDSEILWGKLTLSIHANGGDLYADVFVEGLKESVYSLRLDKDEATVTAYDPGADEGRTVYDGGPVCSHCGGSPDNVQGCTSCCRDCGFPCSAEKDAEGFHEDE